MRAMPTAGQIRAARALLGIDQARVAATAGLSVATLRRVEAGEAPSSAVERVADVLVKQGVAFIDDGVQLQRPRASKEEMDALLARLDAMPVIDPTFTEESLYGDDGLPA